jgi:hypothetical protein
MRARKVPCVVRVDAALSFQIPAHVGDDDPRIAQMRRQPLHRDERSHGY